MIKDSGDRSVFPSGAVRDCQEGKGRCDLLPLDITGHLLDDAVILDIYDFIRTKDVSWLYEALGECDLFDNYETMVLEVAVQFEEGAKKYGDNNWRKGIPITRYIDSAIRHYLKHLRGDTDERHDRAFCWNILCAIWTAKHIEGSLDELTIEEA